MPLTQRARSRAGSFALAAMLAGCAHTPGGSPPSCSFDGVTDISPAEWVQERRQQLISALIALGANVDFVEAQSVADLALNTARALRVQYDVTSASALMHNLSVVNGTKKRGLCVHWTRDLLDPLRALQLESFTLFWAIANQGNLLTEHSAVVIAARGNAFEDGLLLDGWRHSGCLYWAPVTEDTYSWQQAHQYADDSAPAAPR